MKRRHRRIAFIAVGLVGLGVAAYLAASAFRNNLVFFFSPTQVAAKEAPVDRTFRIGGLVQEGSLKRDGLNVQFTVTDTAYNVPVVYKGILPDLFKEGRGCVAQGKISADGVFHADQVLAKHDENYMPPEAGQAIDKAKYAREAAETVVDN
ncbi:MAG TPA: cytochrome c maturation protein CcmE [Pyrinomonadaceae bacterium]|nr:cytochrome c maturation protein CcmE [Pyrinomonadaceae bacterium]